MKDINNILAGYFAGEASAEEKKYVEEWKATNEEEFALLSEAWNETIDIDSTIEFKTFDHKKALEKVNAQLDISSETKIIKLNFYKKVAAACAILLVGLAGFWFIRNNNATESFANNTHTPKQIDLPDGSEVWLAANSTIEYASNFEENRTIELKGEAFFEVKRDEKHPFVVNTDLGQIEVLGTAFNVNTNNQSTVVSVDHGKVAMRHNQDEVLLIKGQSAVSTKDHISEVGEADENYLSWKTGVFEFDNLSIDEVVTLLNKHYEQQITLNESFDHTCRISGNFNNEKIDTIIEAITLLCDVEANYGSDKIELK